MAIGFRGAVTVFLTVLTLVSAIAAFIFSILFDQYLEQLNANFRGELKSNKLPCIRSTLDECSNSNTDKCWVYCCPEQSQYFCFRSPVVGLYCQDSSTGCGDPNWCRDLADVPQTCATEICQTHEMVKRTTTFAYIIAGVGVFIDVVDIITIRTAPSEVVCKYAVNIASSLVKWVAFGIVLGAGTSEFLSDLETARCFNGDGMQLLADARVMFVSFAIVQVLSAVFSMCLAPCSAYWGGKLGARTVPDIK